MPASLYSPIYLWLIVLLSLVAGLRRVGSPSFDIQAGGGGWLFPFLFCVALTFWMGLRPVSSIFGDTVNYAMEYALLAPRDVHPDWHSEWIWQWFMVGCKSMGLSVNVFFLLVETGYVMSAFFAIKKFMPSDPMLGTVFLVTSLMFFTFGTNGLRNGWACHVALLAMAFLFEDKYVWGIALGLLAFGIHRSVALPFASVAAALFIIKDVRYAIYFWLASIFISLVAGGAVSNFFASLGFDGRMTQYTSIDDFSGFSRTGFRWDFLLYSAVPIVFAWYVCVKQGFRDAWYQAICVTYCLCNAFWVMVIRSAFSNRFAYLSWFLYPVVIAYPLVNLPLWDDQDRKTGYIVLAYGGFTFFMLKFVWGWG